MSLHSAEAEFDAFGIEIKKKAMIKENSRFFRVSKTRYCWSN
jgi:hypothetical protein